MGDYWIIDADLAAVEEHILAAGDFVLRLKSSSGTLRSEVLGGFEVPVEALFEEEANLAALREMLGTGTEPLKP